MRSHLLLGILLCLGILGTSYAQTEELFHGLELYESLDSGKAKMEPYAQQIKLIEVENPSFPLSESSEAHVVCMNYETSAGTIAEIVFTFADDKLSYIQAYGNAVEALTGHRKDTAQTYMGYGAYWKDYLVTKPADDKVWILTPEAAHPNLFTWDNPYLPSNGGEAKTYKTSGKVPEFVKMGGKLEDLKPVFEKAALFTNTMELDGKDPNAQLQLDCFGIEYAGFPRKFEARFGDEQLNVVWILTGKGEEERIRQKLIEAYGEIIFKNEAWEVFDNWQVLLRKDKPEVLLLTPELGQFYKNEYFKQQ